MVHWSDLLYKNAQHSDRNFDFDKLYNEQSHVKAVAKDLKIYADGMIDDVRRIALGAAGTAIDWMKEQFDINDVADWGLEKPRRIWRSTMIPSAGYSTATIKIAWPARFLWMNFGWCSRNTRTGVAW